MEIDFLSAIRSWKAAFVTAMVFMQNLLISEATTVMLCHNNVSRSSSLEVNIEPFPVSMLNILSMSVCRSTEYLKIEAKSFRDRSKNAFK